MDREKTSMNRAEYGAVIARRLAEEAGRLREEFLHPGRVQSCVLDDVLPPEDARRIYDAFPEKSTMMLKKSLREFKYVAAQMDKYNPILEEIIYAFQQPAVVKIVSEITGLKDLHPDDRLYAGGISLMDKGQFLNPHLDNSHDIQRDKYRVLNLLYYVTPGWEKDFGGNLELWDNGPKGEPREIVSKFNRLAIMATHETSWHSVNEVRADRNRCCVSNYYFSYQPIENHDYFHVTSFRGRPEQPIRDIVLKGDIAVRMGIRKAFKKGVVKNPHVYQKEDEKP